MVEAIQSFFKSGNLFKEVNATILTLVPKKQNSSQMGEFKPISCCDVVYKCITKILVNRLLPVLVAIISHDQAAFIPSRSIYENVLLAQELVRDYHKEKGKARCTIKVDLMKAYDYVSWEFILQCLKCFGAPANYVNWVRECITNPQFSVAINGTLVGYFDEGRQGDPISPHLFVIVMEVLSKLLAEAALDKNSFEFHPRCSKLQLTYLCFMDDLLIFLAANIKYVQSIKRVLQEFAELLGLSANPSKSSVPC